MYSERENGQLRDLAVLPKGRASTEGVPLDRRLCVT